MGNRSMFVGLDVQKETIALSSTGLRDAQKFGGTQSADISSVNRR
jgi:hypothetical protein